MIWNLYFRKKRVYIEHSGVDFDCQLLLQKQYFALELSQDNEKEGDLKGIDLYGEYRFREIEWFLESELLREKSFTGEKKVDL